MTTRSLLLAVSMLVLGSGCASRPALPEVPTAETGAAFSSDLDELLARSTKGSAPEAQWRALEALRAIPDEDTARVAGLPLLRACRAGRGADVATLLSEYVTKLSRARRATRSIAHTELVWQCGIGDATPREDRLGFVAAGPNHYAVVSESRLFSILLRDASSSAMSAPTSMKGAIAASDVP